MQFSDSFEQHYSKIKEDLNNPQTFKFREFKESGRPRTFTELFNETSQDTLHEAKCFNDMYEDSGTSLN
jgi:hypothetical protein